MAAWAWRAALLLVFAVTCEGAEPPLSDASGTGVERLYRLELTSRAQVADTEPLVALELSGNLSLTQVAEEPFLAVRGEYSGERFALSGRATGEGDSSDAVRRALAEPFYLVFRTQGPTRELVTLRGSPRVIPFVAQIWRAVGAALQVTEGGDTEWQATEVDTSGQYLARYRREPAGDGDYLRLTRTKERYLPSAEPGQATFEIVDARAELALDEAGWPSRLDSNEQLRASVSPFPAIQSATVLSLVRIAQAERLTEVAAFVAELEGFAEITPELVDGHSAATDRAIIGSWTFEEATEVLREEALKTPAAKTEGRERADSAYSALAAMLRLQPERLADVRLEAVEGGPLSATAVAALRDAGTEQAQEVLRDLLAEPSLPLAQRLRILRGLSHVDVPSDATVRVLLELQSDPVLGQQATYGLGSALYRLQKRNPSLAGIILSELLGQLSMSTSPRRTAELLIALGNAGHPGALDAILPHLQAPAAETRAAAAQALRRIEGARVDALLAEACRDPSELVRQSALNAASERSPTEPLVGALAAVIEKEPSFAIRSDALRLAAGWLPEARTELAPPLALMAERDANADLRRGAAQLLGE